MNSLKRCTLYNQRRYSRYVQIVLVWSIVYATHAFLGYYHDDYGYAGLTYFYDVGGTYSERLTLPNYFNFLYQHYMGWGGRVVALGIGIPFMHMGPTVFWFVQSVLVTAIIYFSTIIATSFTEKNDYFKNLVFITSSYMSLAMYLIRDGLYWASASVLYVWPLFFMFLAIFLKQVEHQNKYYIGIIALSFFIAAASSEPFALFVVAYLGVVNLIDFKNKKIIVTNVLFGVISIFGSLFCVLAPGNFNRAALVSGQHVPTVQELFKGIPDALLWILRVTHSYEFSFFIFSLGMATVYFFYLWKNGEKKFECMLPLFAACCASACLFILPAARSLRVIMPIALILPVLAAPFWSSCLKKLPYKNLSAMFIIAIFCYGLSQYIPNLNGYRKNYETMQYNDATLTAHKQYTNIITLKNLPNRFFANDMPYDKDYFVGFIKRYYDIPVETKFVFVD